jgi:FMN phosphatase YigB (HAD superfamily)
MIKAMEVKAILFDADGVLTLPEDVFTVVYAKSHGLDTEPFEQFFRNEWQAIVTGKKDLKESISENPGLWRWNGSPEELLDYWFKTEDVRNEELLQLIGELKAQGMPCYLATDQENYRGEYMKNVMFNERFDGYFISAELGMSKTDPKFFELIISNLQRKIPDLKPADILFFDDSQSKVDTASSVGINGQLYTSIDQVKKLRKE